MEEHASKGQHNTAQDILGKRTEMVCTLLGGGHNATRLFPVLQSGREETKDTKKQNMRPHHKLVFRVCGAASIMGVVRSTQRFFGEGRMVNSLV